MAGGIRGGWSLSGGIVGEGSVEEAALGWGLAGLPCCPPGRMRDILFLFLQLEVTGERQAQGLESETRQAGAYFGSLEWLLVQVASFWS